MAFPFAIASFIPSFLSGNIWKYFGGFALVGSLFFGAWYIVDEYQDLKKLVQSQKQTIEEKDKSIESLIKTAESNKKVIKNQKKSYEKKISLLVLSHKEEMALTKKLTLAREETYYEKDGVVADVLINTLDRLRIEEARDTDSREDYRGALSNPRRTYDLQNTTSTKSKKAE